MRKPSRHSAGASGLDLSEFTGLFRLGNGEIVCGKGVDTGLKGPVLLQMFLPSAPDFDYGASVVSCGCAVYAGEFGVGFRACVLDTECCSCRPDAEVLGSGEMSLEDVAALGDRQK